MIDQLIPRIYDDKINELIIYLDESSNLYSDNLVTNLQNGELNGQNLAFMTPQELKPEKWETIKKKRELCEYKKNNMASTDLYQCKKCKERKCQVRQLQTRGADEPITNFVTCLNCYHTFKVY
jgi:transcription elongation factor S-II